MQLEILSLKSKKRYFSLCNPKGILKDKKKWKQDLSYSLDIVSMWLHNKNEQKRLIEERNRTRAINPYNQRRIAEERLRSIREGFEQTTTPQANRKIRGKIRAASPSSITGDADGAGRSKEAIRRVVMRRIGGLKYLYNKQLKKYPKLNGKVIVKMVIFPSGKVGRAVIIDSSLGNKELERGILKRIKRWKFGRVPKGTATVIYPMNFSIED